MRPTEGPEYESRHHLIAWVVDQTILRRDAYGVDFPVAATIDLIELFHQARKREAAVYFAGNGGAWSLAGHWANELGCVASRGAGAPFKAMALAHNGSWVTTVGNDEGFERLFVDELQTWASPDDVLVVISGSGTSRNILQALGWARELGMTTVGITSQRGEILRDLVDLAIVTRTPAQDIFEDLVHTMLHLTSYWFMSPGSRTGGGKGC